MSEFLPLSHLKIDISSVQSPCRQAVSQLHVQLLHVPDPGKDGLDGDLGPVCHFLRIQRSVAYYSPLAVVYPVVSLCGGTCCSRGSGPVVAAVSPGSLLPGCLPLWCLRLSARCSLVVSSALLPLHSALSGSPLLLWLTHGSPSPLLDS